MKSIATLLVEQTHAHTFNPVLKPTQMIALNTIDLTLRLVYGATPSMERISHTTITLTTMAVPAATPGIIDFGHG